MEIRGLIVKIMKMVRSTTKSVEGAQKVMSIVRWFLGCEMVENEDSRKSYFMKLFFNFATNVTRVLNPVLISQHNRFFLILQPNTTNTALYSLV